MSNTKSNSRRYQRNPAAFATAGIELTSAGSCQHELGRSHQECSQTKGTTSIIIQVIYNISQDGQIELIYSQIALAEYYLSKGMLESAKRVIDQSRDIKTVGDTSFLLGSIRLRENSRQEGIIYLQNCIKEEWIEPSDEHRLANKL